MMMFRIGSQHTLRDGEVVAREEHLGVQSQPNQGHRSHTPLRRAHHRDPVVQPHLLLQVEVGERLRLRVGTTIRTRQPTKPLRPHQWHGHMRT